MLVPVLVLASACAGAGDDDPIGRDGGPREVDDSGTAVTGGSSGSAGSPANAGSGTAESAAGSAGRGGSGTAAAGSSSPRPDAGSAAGSGGSAPPEQPELGSSVVVHLVPSARVSGSQRINFAVPLARGELADAAKVRVLRGAEELAAARRELARYGDDSVRSVQIQLDLDVTGETDVEVRLGETPSTAELTLAPAASTLVAENGEQGPRVWALLPAQRLSQSGLAGPLVPEADVASEPAGAWASLCDYEEYDLAAFRASGFETDRAVWLFDRGTAMYRGYARRGDLATLQAAYVETAIYRNGITGTGMDARNGIPGGGGEDVKYTYAQNLALHYLLTGDERYRESAEDMALAMSVLWSDPGYGGGSDFWTERHAGFGLLAFVWAMIVSDDRSEEFRALADEAVSAYLDMQATYPPGYTDQDARCFAHTGDAHGEGGAYFGCSPWMSAILGDGLEQYATESEPARAEEVRESLVKLGRIIAERGIQPDGRPYYFMGVGTTENMLDEYDEHLGESAYLIAMSWYFSGRSDGALRGAADTLIELMAEQGSAPHIRSFNWQCRSAVAAPWFLR